MAQGTYTGCSCNYCRAQGTWCSHRHCHWMPNTVRFGAGTAFFGRRYFYPQNRLVLAMRLAKRAAEASPKKGCECEFGPCPTEFDTGLIVDFGMYESLRGTQMPKIIERVFSVKTWRNVNHHESHALMAYYSSPFRSSFFWFFPLMVAGTMALGMFLLDRALRSIVLHEKGSTSGAAYTRGVGSLLPAVMGLPALLREACVSLLISSRETHQSTKTCFKAIGQTWTLWTGRLEKGMKALLERLMGYSGIKPPSAEASEWLASILWTHCFK